MKKLVLIMTNIFFAVLVMMTLSFSNIALAQFDGEKETEPESIEIEYSTLTADDGTEFSLKKTKKIYRDDPAPWDFSWNVFDFTEYIGEITCNNVSIWQYRQNVPIGEITIEKEKEYKDFTTYRVTILECTDLLHLDNIADYIKKDDKYFEVSIKLLWIDKENHKYCGSFNENHLKYRDDPEYYDIFKEMYTDTLDSHVKKYNGYIAEGKYFALNRKLDIVLFHMARFDEELCEKYREELSSIRKSGFVFTVDGKEFSW